MVSPLYAITICYAVMLIYFVVPSVQGHLHTYRFCDNVWTFILQDATFKNEESQDTVGRVKIVACDSKLLSLWGQSFSTLLFNSPLYHPWTRILVFTQQWPLRYLQRINHATWSFSCILLLLGLAVEKLDFVVLPLCSSFILGVASWESMNIFFSHRFYYICV